MVIHCYAILYPHDIDMGVVESTIGLNHERILLNEKTIPVIITNLFEFGVGYHISQSTYLYICNIYIIYVWNIFIYTYCIYVNICCVEICEHPCTIRPVIHWLLFLQAPKQQLRWWATRRRCLWLMVWIGDGWLGNRKKRWF